METTSVPEERTRSAAKRRRAATSGQPAQTSEHTAETSKPTSDTILRSLMDELKEMREERERMRDRFEETLRLRDVELLCLQAQISGSNNISLGNNARNTAFAFKPARETRVQNIPSGDSVRGASFTFGPGRATETNIFSSGSLERGAAFAFGWARDAGVSACAGRIACGDSVKAPRVMGASESACTNRASRGLKLKPDTFDGTAPLREFLAQFLLIARANFWTEAEKVVVLASCLRGKARSLLESCADGIESLTFAELTEKLELRFGEGHLSQNYYSLFTNRKQKFGEDFAALGSDLERLSRLAYPECTYAVRDKIACSQFVSALTDGFVKRTLQLEGVTSLKVAVERAKAVKAIQGESFSERNKSGKFFGKNGDSYEKAKPGVEEPKEKGDAKGEKKFFRNKPKECWLCGRQGHFRNECPNKKGNAV